MVKLPVIVYNRKSQEDVFVSAISLRRKLENEAVEEQKMVADISDQLFYFRLSLEPMMTVQPMIR